MLPVFPYGLRHHRYVYEGRAVRASLPGGLHSPQAGGQRLCGGAATLRESRRLHRLRSVCAGLPDRFDLSARRTAARIGTVRSAERRALQLATFRIAAAESSRDGSHYRDRNPNEEEVKDGDERDFRRMMLDPFDPGQQGGTRDGGPELPFRP